MPRPALNSIENLVGNSTNQNASFRRQFLVNEDTDDDDDDDAEEITLEKIIRGHTGLVKRIDVKSGLIDDEIPCSQRRF